MRIITIGVFDDASVIALPLEVSGVAAPVPHPQGGGAGAGVTVNTHLGVLFKAVE
ncbi:hypothetical protein LPH50_00945 [Xylella taiwanensis]|uniref:Uncharacterized protein n=1 Tax=Xylella taiwanensis TaxID=1444770 RepID=A0ABS8TZ80_9GAMM|nr:hypothetical protein [Xylella taiwanensis]MCD8456809.1 hypothetical protein [Xylella taiwanensis]MCD8459219.1 hypothetical protein [Xylella taiwanensis]MCD8462055.1 hypothetical protein [Xylella taiwanensis]MCD8464307.1 hypothetical protein [Xylella taiwanensis]MCD8466563.1 hypothetical protein [Xylella taiwanensis]